ncbi:MAG: heterodisulfide reductase-related iron-sulfur binding cluster, partial [Burkholderiales bacterium]
FRVTREEQHLTRGRANTLRLALSGQLGPEAFTSDEMAKAMDLCVSCKGCKRECPTGVDMAKMKAEFLHHYKQRHGFTLKDKLIAGLPHYAPWVSKLGLLANIAQAIGKGFAGFASQRSLPKWKGNAISALASAGGRGQRVAKSEVVLFIDTFNNYFEPDNAHAALKVLEAAGYTVHVPHAKDKSRPLCCGRTFLATGMVDKARAEAQRTIDTLMPYIERGVPIVGLEPSCLLGMRDEFLSMLPNAQSAELALNAYLFEEFIARELDAGRFKLNLKALPQKKALLHGHCHQKAFAAMPAVLRVLKLIPELQTEMIESSCCGMAGSFGYDAEHFDVSMQMAEASLLPKVREASKDTLIIADGTSCRHQIQDGAQREAIHVARVLADALA